MGKVSRASALVTLLCAATAVCASAAAAAEMTFVERKVTTPPMEGIDGGRALGSSNHYEPSLIAAPCPRSRCRGGVIVYFTAHTLGALTTRSPAFYSRDRGRTWHTMPSPVPTGSTRPVGGVHGAEADFAADGSGRAWLYDAGSTVSQFHGFCGFAARQCELVPLVRAGTQCSNVLTDRPWLAYGGGKLLLVDYAGGPGGATQLAVYDPATGAFERNDCATGSSGRTGHPAAAPTGAFAAPRTWNEPDRQETWLIEGNLRAGVAPGELTHRRVDALTVDQPPGAGNGCSGGGAWSSAAFDRDSTLYVAAWAAPTRFAIATGPSGGTLEGRSFDAHGNLKFLWISGSQRGAGALVTWAVDRRCESVPFVSAVGYFDVYAAHVIVEGGVPRLVDESLVATNVEGLSGDYIGSSLGPDGRAYIANYSSPLGNKPLPGEEPLSAFVQTRGPTL